MNLNLKTKSYMLPLLSKLELQTPPVAHGFFDQTQYLSPITNHAARFLAQPDEFYTFWDTTKCSPPPFKYFYNHPDVVFVYNL